MLVVKIGIALVLLAMAWQDFRDRAIAIWLFVLLFIGLIGLKYSLLGRTVLFSDFKVNMIFLAMQLLCLFLYFSWKEKRWVNLFNGYFGEGDLLFLVGVATYLSFFNFVWFHLISLFIVMLISVFVRKTDAKIPLAGGQALCLVLAMAIDQWSSVIDLSNDLWFIRFSNW
ncbi:hypothetical protein [Pedobacter sp. ASV28]|uniref:hypothetical protein n=1 Tax=Pedobacter sp. ASV28 TaxID=2795123 RepID=UPI0018EB5973|nr:hypothetical protein [Pedobacter sp. ASV28]